MVPDTTGRQSVGECSGLLSTLLDKLVESLVVSGVSEWTLGGHVDCESGRQVRQHYRVTSGQ